MVVGGFDTTLGNTLEILFPQGLEKLYLNWRRGTGFYDSTLRGQLSDTAIRNILNEDRRDSVDSCMRALFKKNPSFRVYMDAIIGYAPSDEVCSSNNSWQFIRH